MLESSLPSDAYYSLVLPEDPSWVHAASWRLASEFARRHPREVRLLRGFPGGGQYDVLWLLGNQGVGDVRLNRHGTIQIASRFDGRELIEWEPVSWEEYVAADPAGLCHPTGERCWPPITRTRAGHDSGDGASPRGRRPRAS